MKGCAAQWRVKISRQDELSALLSRSGRADRFGFEPVARTHKTLKLRLRITILGIQGYFDPYFRPPRVLYNSPRNHIFINNNDL